MTLKFYQNLSEFIRIYQNLSEFIRILNMDRVNCTHL
jgi:hypothetical protein